MSAKRPLCPVCEANPVTTGSKSGLCRTCFVGLSKAEGRTLTVEELQRYAEERGDTAKTIVRVSYTSKYWHTRPVLVRGDAMLISDMHVPRHCPVTVDRMLDVARRLRIRQLVVGGDLMDFEEISRHRHATPDAHPIESIHASIAVLEALSSWFRRIWVVKGNHDDRLQRLIEAAVQGRTSFQKLLADLTHDDVEALPFRHRYTTVMEAWTRRLAPRLSKRVTWLPSPEIEIEGPEGMRPYRFVHPAIYSRNAPQAERRLWTRYVQPIVGTHGHLWGMSLSPNGEHPIIQIGCATIPEKHMYLAERVTDHPKWVRGFASIKDGVIQCYVMNPYLTKESP